MDSFLEMYFCKTVSKIKDRSGIISQCVLSTQGLHHFTSNPVRILFPTSEVASDQLQRLNSARYEGCRLSATYGHPDSLLFVGNLSCTYSHEDLLWLFQPHGDILRCFVVCSLSTGLSKGYGFVEFSSRDEAAEAKLHLATKVVGQRSLRVDFADNGMQTVDDLHSRTLFVDRLPKGFVDDDVLRDKFSAYGIVNFCQVSMHPHTYTHTHSLTHTLTHTHTHTHTHSHTHTHTHTHTLTHTHTHTHTHSLTHTHSDTGMFYCHLNILFCMIT